MEKYRKLFNQYFKRFNIKEPNILRKFHHSYRVMEYSKEIGKSLNFDEHDIWLCEMVGLFHDIGRFEQWTKYETYNDHDSIDHGDLSYKIIQEEDILKEINEVDKKIILTAIKHHNKYDLNGITEERVKLFCEIIRDADKLDILFEQGNTIKNIQSKLNDNLIKEIYNKKLCSNKFVKSDVDIVLRQIGFIFDLKFKYSFKLLKEKEWFKNKFNLLENYVEDKDSVKELQDFINNYLEEKILC